jgi:hypothetical protein
VKLGSFLNVAQGLRFRGDAVDGADQVHEGGEGHQRDRSKRPHILSTIISKFPRWHGARLRP